MSLHEIRMTVRNQFREKSMRQEADNSTNSYFDKLDATLSQVGKSLIAETLERLKDAPIAREVIADIPNNIVLLVHARICGMLEANRPIDEIVSFMKSWESLIDP